MRAFEIYTYRESKWKMDSVFDDRELAMYEAKKIAEGSRFSGVKVIEENYDETTNLTTTQTLYRGGAAKTEKKKPAAKTARAGARAGATREPSRKRGTKPRNSKKKSSVLVPVLVLLVLLLGGVALLFGLQHFSSLQ